MEKFSKVAFETGLYGAAHWFNRNIEDMVEQAKRNSKPDEAKVITNRLNHRLRRCDRRRFDRYGVEIAREKGSNHRATGWSEKERAYARMEKTKTRHLLLPLPYRLHPQVQEKGDIWKTAQRDRRNFP
jgi:hypothetical protein